MAASTTDAPPDKDLQNPALVYEPKFDGIRALVSAGAGDRPAARPAVVAERQRQDLAVPRGGQGTPRVRAAAEGPGPPRRRGRRARRPRRARRLPAAAGPHAPQGRARHRPRGDRAAGRVHRLRHPARGRRGSAPADPHPPPRAARTPLRRLGILGGAARRIRRRRRPPSLCARDRAGLGRARRQARRLALRERPAQPVVDQAEDQEDRVAGRRRLDRAARDAQVLRRAGARRVHGRGAATRSCATSATSAAASPIAS